MISGSFAKNDLQLKASYGPSPPCTFPDLSHHVCCCGECITQKQMRICPKKKESESLEIEILFLSTCRTISAEAGRLHPKTKENLPKKKKLRVWKLRFCTFLLVALWLQIRGEKNPKRKEKLSQKKEIENLEIEILYLPTCRNMSAAAGSATPKNQENWSQKKRN